MAASVYIPAPGVFLTGADDLHPREECKVIYKSKYGRQQKAFDALEWLAVMSSHIPDEREQMVRYYGHYSNVCRGRRQKENQDGWHLILFNTKRIQKNNWDQVAPLRKTPEDRHERE